MLSAALAERLQASFVRGAGDGLLQLGAGEVGQALPPSPAYWREFAGQFVAALCTRAEPGPAEPLSPPPLPLPTAETLHALAAAVPPMLGAEYLSVELLQALWRQLDAVVQRELARPQASLQELLQRYHPSWHLVGRVNFHLAENRQDPERPFAFMATYTHALSAQGSARHLPLGQALREYAGAANKAQLLALLLPRPAGYWPIYRTSSARVWWCGCLRTGRGGGRRGRRSMPWLAASHHPGSAAARCSISACRSASMASP